MDIGITRGEIDYVVSHRGSTREASDPANECRYLAAVEGRGGPADVPRCVDGSGLARAFFTFAALVGAAMCPAF